MTPELVWAPPTTPFDLANLVPWKWLFLGDFLLPSRAQNATAVEIMIAAAVDGVRPLVARQHCSAKRKKCPALLCFMSLRVVRTEVAWRPCPAREGEVAAAAALIPSPITHPGVCDSCFVVVALPPPPSPRRRNRVAVP